MGWASLFRRIIVTTGTGADSQSRRRYAADAARSSTSAASIVRPVTHERPSKNEDEYFARRDAELLRQQHAAVVRAAAERERKSHHMKCPKCGYDLITGDWDGIQIDQCTHCHGVWFDAHEAQALMKTSTPNILGRVFRAVAKGVTRR